VTVDQPEHRKLRQQQAATTQRQLLAAACDVFERRGYQATTVGAITDRANTAHGTFYLYFRNKEDAFCRVVEAVVVDELVAGTETLLRGGSRREKLEQAMRGFVAIYARHIGLWRALLEGMLQSRVVEDLWLELRRQRIMQVASDIGALHRRGDVRPVDPVMVAHALTAMTEWFAFTHLALDEPPTGDSQHEALVTTLADIWLHAIYGRVPDSPAG
jgi:AcrR family transcriptional regulator